MPKVPVYEERTVESRPIATPMIPIERPLGLLYGAEIIKRGVRTAGAYVLKEVEEQRSARVLDSEYKSQEGFDTDVSEFTQQFQGPMAIEKVKEWEGKIEQRYQDARAQFDRDDEKRAFDARVMPRVLQAKKQLHAHVVAEGEAYKKQVFASQEQLAMKDIGNAADVNDPAAWQNAMSRQSAVIAMQLEQEGITDLNSPEATARFDQFQSNAWATILTRMAPRFPVEAKKLFEQNGDKLQSDQHTAIENTFKTIDVRQKGLTDALAIWDKTGKDLELALTDARLKYSGDVAMYDEVTSRLKGFDNERKDVLASSRAQLYERTDLQFKRRNSVSSIDPTDWNRLPVERQEYYRRVEDEIRNGNLLKLTDVKDDVLSLWYKYKMLPPEQKYAFDYETTFRGKVPMQLYVSDVNELSNIRDSVDAAKTKATTKDPHTELRSVKQQIDDAAKANGYIPADNDKAKPADVRKYILLMQDIENDINDEERKLKPPRKLTAEERQPIIDANVLKGRIPIPWAIDPKIQEFEAATYNRGNLWVPDPVERQTFTVPPVERDQIISSKKRRGEPYTEADIRKGYYDILLQIRARTHNQ